MFENFPDGDSIITATHRFSLNIKSWRKGRNSHVILVPLVHTINRGIHSPICKLVTGNTELY